MPYSITKTDGSPLTDSSGLPMVVLDNTINTDKTLVFIGKDYGNYGEILNENLLKLMENFANTSPPSGPVTGQLWYDATAGAIKVYKGPSTGWVPLPSVTNIAGTTNQITVTISGPNVTLSLPQNINNAASPTFNALNLSQSTGTAPMTVQSTTLVNNLNADKLDGQDGAYYLSYANMVGAPTLAANPAVTTNDTTLATTGFVHSILPAGTIVLWSGSVATIPNGWVLCNGGNGTPDLRDKFVIGAGNLYAPAATASTGNKGTGASLPAYYALCYIMKQTGV